MILRRREIVDDDIDLVAEALSDKVRGLQRACDELEQIVKHLDGDDTQGKYIDMLAERNLKLTKYQILLKWVRNDEV